MRKNFPAITPTGRNLAFLPLTDVRPLPYSPPRLKVPRVTKLGTTIKISRSVMNLYRTIR